MDKSTSVTAAPAPASDQILTIPNLLSLLRLAGVPLFLWLVLGPHADLWAFVVVIVAGASDYFDGKLARILHQTSKLGTMLDPLADRAYILAVVLAFAIRGFIPWWLLIVVVARDVVLLATVPVLRRMGLAMLPVHFVGKAGTFVLLYAFPLLLLASGHGWWATVARPVAWSLTLWGVALYWIAGLIYVAQVIRLFRVAKAPSDR